MKMGQLNLFGQSTKTKSELKIEAKDLKKQRTKKARAERRKNRITGYGLHCFDCGYPFRSKEEVHRVGNEKWNNHPLCERCYGEALQSKAESEVFEDHENKRIKDFMERRALWERNGKQGYFPESLEEEEIDKANLRKYGEF